MTADPNSEYKDNIYAYNLDRDKTPGGMKVRWKIRIATGAEAERLDIIQQQAIINLLTWADKHYNPGRQAAGIAAQPPEIPGSNSPEPVTINAE